MAQKKYDDRSKEELVRLLEFRDRRDATRFGLVWEPDLVRSCLRTANNVQVEAVLESLARRFGMRI